MARVRRAPRPERGARALCRLARPRAVRAGTAHPPPDRTCMCPRRQQPTAAADAAADALHSELAHSAHCLIVMVSCDHTSSSRSAARGSPGQAYAALAPEAPSTPTSACADPGEGGEAWAHPAIGQRRCVRGRAAFGAAATPSRCPGQPMAFDV